jgi:hypothetical protein
MPVKYRVFRHRSTGEVVESPAGRYGNFLLAVRKLVQYNKYNNSKYLFCCHLTLTVAENVSEVDCGHLNRTITFIRTRLQREGSDFKYVAVKELQRRGAIHLHILCFYTQKGAFPSKADVARSWRLGFADIRAPKKGESMGFKASRIVGYISKYIGKGYEMAALETRKSFTASQVVSLYKLRADRLAAVVERWGVYAAKSFRCTFRKVIHELKLGREVMSSKVLFEWPPEWWYEGIITKGG